jgi:AcrR family transcriptional regulator
VARRTAAATVTRAARVYDPEQTLERLVEAAIDLFGRQGFHVSSVREIVDAAGLTKGAFYHHFESKEELLHLIHDRFIEFHLAGQQLIFDEVQTPHERLYHLVRLLTLVVARYPNEVAVYFQEHRVLAGVEFSDVSNKRSKARRGFVDVITAGVDNGDFRPETQPEMATMGVLGMGNWIYQWYSDSTPWSPDEIGRSFGLMALRGLTAKPRMVTAIAGRKLDPQRDPVLKLLEQSQADGRRSPLYVPS